MKYGVMVVPKTDTNGIKGRNGSGEHESMESLACPERNEAIREVAFN
jgi:hypothetical protein